MLYYIILYYIILLLGRMGSALINGVAAISSPFCQRRCSRGLLGEGRTGSALMIGSLHFFLFLSIEGQMMNGVSTNEWGRCESYSFRQGLFGYQSVKSTNLALMMGSTRISCFSTEWRGTNGSALPVSLHFHSFLFKH